MADFSDLLGVTLAKIEGATAGSELIKFEAADGRRWQMYHPQDCCEWVEVNEVIGDIADLIGTPIARAEEAESGDDAPEGCDESHTWTFYKLATIKGEVVIRWLGQSNGYYSESVYFQAMTQ